MTNIPATDHNLLTLLQLASPALPIGAYSYSEGIESLTSQGTVSAGEDLLQWLSQELMWGSIRIETAVMRRVYELADQSQVEPIDYWNQWISAFRDAEELRSQSWQMGRSLLRLFADLEPERASAFPASVHEGNCNFAIAYGLVAEAWKIPLAEVSLAYLHSWAANLVSAAVRAVPLGQTEGQRRLRQLAIPISQAHTDIEKMTEDDFMACSWGVSLACMQHETLYSRLFRS
ncbi:urease accessory protein UreF [Oscillatoria sp. CS-180]|uniref:urease accessory protein UreF n=1 Tax=Oscillatoria sp. CS-180 TaxID=3021720 RepID=UPI00232E2A11|nr:urease accessory protein UreF [Oscillatoria sp. CS-180]MDB9526086.1 urease accessory protein UreF [Oscillatoria sp. CS-180]